MVDTERISSPVIILITTLLLHPLSIILISRRYFAYNSFSFPNKYCGDNFLLFEEI